MKVKTNFKSFSTYLLIVFASSFLTGCEKDNQDYIPSCIAEQIQDISKNTCEGGAGIVKYLFQLKIVYYIDPGFCYYDQTYDIVDSDCNVIGQIGGFAGSRINGVDFFDNAAFLSIVWER